MALDAATLSLCAAELKEVLSDARIDKIHQPTHDEVVFAMRTRKESFRLLLSARSGSARICLTRETYENPSAPPSFCMLLRKYLTGGRLLDVRTLPAERIAFFDFLCTNELGDLVLYTLAAELMGRYCNLVLIGGKMAPAALSEVARQGPKALAEAVKDTEFSLAGGGHEDSEPVKIIDALKRVDFEDSDIRQLLPGLVYALPPMPKKPDFITAPVSEILDKTVKVDAPVAEALRRSVGGVGPVVAREAAYRAFGGEGGMATVLSEDEIQRLAQEIEGIRSDFAMGGIPCLVRKADGLPTEFSFTRLSQYLPGCTLEEFSSYSEMLEGYYAEKDRIERLRQKSKELRRTVQNMYERSVRKQAARKEDLAKSEQSEHLRVKGELLTSNLHAYEKGDASVTLLNWYSGEEEKIKLDIRLSPSQNAQKYFKEYKKKQTAMEMLEKLLISGEHEVKYLETVLYEIDNAGGENALGEIRAELKAQGYLRHYKQRDKKQKPADYIRYTSEDGFLILVGRNNAQNEKLTLKTARGKDMWFHVKNAPGSHVVVMSEGKDIPLSTQNEAAMLAVHYSSQKNGNKIPVDYTQVKNIRKTGDLPIGMVLYEQYETAYITPDTEIKNKIATTKQ